MRDAPEPIPMILPQEQNCAGCEDKPIRVGYRFHGSDATFCDECAAYITRERKRHQIEFEIRACDHCGEDFRCFSDSSRTDCQRCNPGKKPRRAIRFDNDLFDVQACKAQ